MLNAKIQLVQPSIKKLLFQKVLAVSTFQNKFATANVQYAQMFVLKQQILDILKHI
jgi:hypothetical protein